MDVVINTHLHLNHTGWNTRLEDGQRVPTFPNARYLMPKIDFDFWNPASGHVSTVLGQGTTSVSAGQMVSESALCRSPATAGPCPRIAHRTQPTVC